MHSWLLTRCILFNRRLVILHITDNTSEVVPSHIFNESFILIRLEKDTPLNIKQKAVGILLDTHILMEHHYEIIYENRPFILNATLCICTDYYDNTLAQSISLLMQTVYFSRNQIEENYEYEWNRISTFFLSNTKAKDYNNIKKESEYRNDVMETLRMIAHQWRQPVNLISMEAINLMIHANIDTTIKAKSVLKSANLISQQTQRISDILKSILNIGKEGRLKHLFSINGIYDSIILFFNEQFKNQNIELIIEPLDEDIQIYGYQTDLEEVLFNLIANARDAYMQNTLEGTRIITLSTTIELYKYIFTIKDEAGGVPIDIQEKIFEANFSTKHKSGGFGIGLHVARLIIEKEFGGTLSLQSNKTGSKFLITIPRNDISTIKFIH